MDRVRISNGTTAGESLLGDGSILLVHGNEESTMRRAIERIGRALIIASPDEAGAIFQESSALIAFVDAREGSERVFKAIAVLGALAERRGAALVVLVKRHQPDALAAAHEAGATHILPSGGGPALLAATLRSADRYVRRLRAHGDAASVATARAALVGGARWEWRRGSPEVALSPALAEMLGGSADATRLRVAQAFGRLDPPDRSDFARALARLARVGLSGELSHRLTIDGAVRMIAHHVRAHRDTHGRLTRLTGIVEDLDAVLAERRLSARFDTLTGLANAGFARDWIDSIIGGAGNYDPACIVLMLSLSRFDGINAAYGREVADGLLQAVARRLRRVVGADKPEARVLARVAGAEFIVAFAGPVQLSDVTSAARRLGVIFDRPFLVDGRTIHLACRMGVALSEDDGAGADVLLRRASAALARAKEGEPGGFEVFGGTGEVDLLARAASLGDDLRAGIETDAFELVYQPQVESLSNRIVGVEALIRWRHPTLGLLSAETLMDVAERAEIGPRLGEHILRKALAEAVAWPDSLTRLRLSVNATADDLMAPDFADRVLRASSDSGFPPNRLTIEATESGLMRDIAQAARALTAIRAHGICVAIDDFGTGYSSLAYLSALPADYLKVDKSLIVDLFGSARDRVVVRGVVDIARSLDLRVVAEGVETDEQRVAAAAAGCQLYQGFLCSRPIAGDLLPDLVRDWNSAADAALADYRE